MTIPKTETTEAPKNKGGRPPGGTKAGGRVKGTPNRVTASFRETILNLIETQSHKFEPWLNSVAQGIPSLEEGRWLVKPDPGRALELVAKIAEFAAPKLARTEHTGLDGAKLTITLLDSDRGLL